MALVYDHATRFETPAQLLEAVKVELVQDVTELSHEREHVLRILVAYYHAQDMPDCGKLAWIRRDWRTYCATGECMVLRRLQRRTRTTSKTNETHGPDWRGPEGKWSLD